MRRHLKRGRGGGPTVLALLDTASLQKRLGPTEQLPDLSLLDDGVKTRLRNAEVLRK
jgi:hypothetical protein